MTSSATSLTLIVTVLKSYEVVRRQLLHWERSLTPDCTLVLVDDGSVPPLADTCSLVHTAFDLIQLATHDRRPWTQPRARNLGAKLARSDKLLFFDIDHIVTRDVICRCLDYSGDKLHWTREPGILDSRGQIITDRCTLVEYGLTDDRPSVHGNSFMIRAELFWQLGGYDERFCGHYGGDDIDFQARYDRLCEQGLAQPAEVAGLGYVFPDPARDVKRLFHGLPR